MSPELLAALNAESGAGMTNSDTLGQANAVLPSNEWMQSMAGGPPMPGTPDWLTGFANASNYGMLAGGPMVGAIRAFHGSPHNFDAFDMSKIGTGEGAQAYGHGLYFAENEGVAKNYRDQLSTAKISHPQFGDNLGFMRLDTNFANAAIKAAPAIGMKRAEEIGTQVSEGLRQGDDIAHMRRFVAQSDWSQAEKDAWKGALDHATEYTAVKNPGSTYEVSINADPEHFLDWDKPLSEQPKAVQEALAKTPGIAPEYLKSKVLTGGNLVPKNPDAMEALRAAGIKGIRYKDAGSRASEGGTHNYVVFDDKIIDILKKYGIAGLALGGAATAAAGANQLAQPGT